MDDSVDELQRCHSRRAGRAGEGWAGIGRRLAVDTEAPEEEAQAIGRILEAKGRVTVEHAS